MKSSPLGAFGAMVFTIGEYGIGKLGNLVGLVATFYLTSKFMSECRALTNLVGNGVATVVVSAWENELGRAKLHAALYHPITVGDRVEATPLDRAI